MIFWTHWHDNRPQYGLVDIVAGDQGLVHIKTKNGLTCMNVTLGNSMAADVTGLLLIEKKSSS